MSDPKNIMVIYSANAGEKFVDFGWRIAFVELADKESFTRKNLLPIFIRLKTMEMTIWMSSKMHTETEWRVLKIPFLLFTVNIVLKKHSMPLLYTTIIITVKEQFGQAPNILKKAGPLGYALFMMPFARQEYAHGLSILSYMKFEEVESGRDSHNTVSEHCERGTDYEARKKMKAESWLIKCVSNFLIYVTASSRITVRRLCLTAIILATVTVHCMVWWRITNIRWKLLSLPRTKLPNPYLYRTNLNFTQMS